MTETYGLMTETSGPMTDFASIDIHELLPQQPPFIMVGRLLHYDPSLTVTETEVSDQNIFTEQGRFTAPGLIENMAQTCAARIGYYNKYVLKQGIQLGFIGAVRGFRIHRLPTTGETIRTSINTIEEIMGMLMVEGRAQCGDETIAEATMKIALSDIESQAANTRKA